MPRLSSLFPLGLAAVASAVLLAPPSVSFVDSATVAIGDICGNADNCGSDGVCLYNHCIPASAVEEGTNGTASSASFAGKGNRCSADDCCGNNLLCLNIVGLGGAQQCWSRDDIGGGADDNSGSNPGFTVVQCTGSPKEGADLSTPNGGGAGTIGQPCGAQSCCTDGLVCVDLAGAGICTESVQGVTTIACNGTPPTPTPNPGPIPTPTPTPTPTPSPPSASETGTNVEPTPVPSSPNGGATGTNSGPTTPTPTPTPTTPPTTATGNGGNTGSTDQPAAGSLGQTCGGAEQNGCCTGGLVCDATSGTCRPNVPGLASLGCNGAPGTPATQTVPVSCSVSKVCAAGSTCIANYCVVDAQVTAGQVWGFGNQCSATVCCPNKLVCLTDAGGRCGVQTGNLRTTTCTASGAATSGQTITSNGQAPAPITPISSGNGGNGGSNGATSLTIGSTSYFAALAGLAVMVLTLVA